MRKLEPPISMAQEEFLKVGARTYLDATTALLVYEQKVQEKCGRIMSRYIDRYAAVLKIDPPLKAEDIRTKVWPGPGQRSEPWRSLGAEVVRKNLGAVPWWGAYCCLEWDADEPKFFAWVGEWYNAKMAQHLSDSFGGVERLDDNNVGIREILKFEDGATFESKLEQLFGKWINLWRKAGGFDKVFRNFDSSS